MRTSYWPDRAISHPKWRFEPLPQNHWFEAVGMRTPRLFMASCPLVELPDLGWALKEGSCYIGKRHVLRAIRYGKSKIIGSDVWQGGVEGANSTIAHCGVGGYATPGALGRAVLREYYPGTPTPPIRNPRGALRAALSDGLVGGRCDLIQPAYKGPLWDADITMAYPAALQDIPAGEPIRLTSSEPWDEGPSYRWWTLDEGYGALGPLPLRELSGLHYPVCGPLTGWYWSDEIDRARAAGWSAEPGPGWGWLGRSWELATGAAALWRLRQTAPTQEVADNIKLAAVEAIGLWAVGTQIVRIGGEVGDGLEYIDELSGRTGLGEVTEDTGGSLLHLASWAYMRCRCMLYDAALPAAQCGTLVATNFDEIYTTEEPTWLDRGDGLGQWKTRLLTNAQAPRPRWIESDQKTRRPGQPA